MTEAVKKKNIHKKHSISRYFIVSVFIIATLLIVIPLITIFILTQAYDAQIRSETHQASFSIQQNVQSFVDGAYNLSRELAENPSVLTMNNSIVTPILADCVTRNDYMVLLYVTGIDGMQVARSSGNLGDRSGRFWFIQMIKTGQPFVSPSYFSLTGNMPCTSIFLPMFNKDSGEMTGIFGADIDLVYLQQLTEQFANPSSGRYSFIIDGEGVVIAHPDNQYLETLTNYKTLVRTVSVMDEYGNVLLNPDGSVKTEDIEFTVSDGFKYVINAVMSGTSGLEIVEYKGQNHYMSYEPITLPGYSDTWSVITMQDRKVAMSVASQLLTQVIIIVVFILAVFIALIAGFLKTLRKTMMNLEIANERFSVMLDTTPLICHLWNREGQVFDCNETAIKLFGFEKKIHLEKFLELAPEYQSDGQLSVIKTRKLLNTAFSDGICIFDWMHKDKSGTLIPMEVTLTRVEYEGDYIAVSYGRDLREQIKMTRELEASQATTFAMFDANPHINILFNSSFKVIDCNTTAMRFMGFDKKEDMLEGFAQRVINSLPKVQPDGRVSKTLEERLMTAAKEGVDKFETELHLGDKIKTFNIEFRKIPYEDSFAIIAYAHDISETKYLINEAEKQRQEAEIASQSKSNFLANMSHEMRTPMNAIIGMTAIGKKSNDIEQKNHALNKIGDASSHLLGVINDVLDMAKIEANKLELAPIEYNFERMLQKVLTVINFRVEEKQQKLKVNVNKNLPNFLIGDEQRLIQVITNLLSNAVKFTPESGEISLDACLIGEIDGICEIRIEVTDSGIGISSEKHNKLFLAFEQAESGTSRQYGGTGLGLSISKCIIELMDGRIWVESELGKGAKFIFTVKVQRNTSFSALHGNKNIDTNESLDIINNIGHDSHISAGEFGGKKLLVAEDVEINREILIALLEDTGLIIDCAENGEQAYKMIEAAPDKYDIILMDVQMPVMNGYEAARRIRAFEKQQDESGTSETRSDNRYPHSNESGTSFTESKTRSDNGNSLPRIPIIALTANVFKSDVEECLAAGMDDHLGKPVDIDRVIEKLRKYLK